VTTYARLTPSADIAGVDEAGRGPLAGPVVVAAVVLDPRRFPAGLDDSKRLSPRQRAALQRAITDQALAYSIVQVEPGEIDRVNILQATLHGMREALLALPRVPAMALIDGNHLPTGLPCPAEFRIGGDALEPAISAASILAKEARDALMRDLHERYPEYGFDRHMGYPTAAHLAALRLHGPCPAHRRSFAPVRACNAGPAQEHEQAVPT